jgi:hypothetical protein
MLVRLDSMLGRHDGHSSAHPQVYDQRRITLDSQEQVLRSSIYSEKPPSDDPSLYFLPVDGLAKIGATNHDTLDRRTDHPWHEAPSKHLDFRKLWHPRDA